MKSIKEKDSKLYFEIIIDEVNKKSKVFKVYKQFLEEANLTYKVGEALDFEEFLNINEMTKCYDRAIYYITLKDCSTNEMGIYLKRKKYNKNIVEQIIYKLENEKLLDDERFANKYYESLVLFKKLGVKKVKQKMNQKGLSSSLIKQCLENYSDDLKVDNARYHLEKKILKTKEKQKILSYLEAKGFNYDIIEKLLYNYSDDFFKEASSSLKNLEQTIKKAMSKHTTYLKKYDKYQAKQKTISYLLSKNISYEKCKEIFEQFNEEN